MQKQKKTEPMVVLAAALGGACGLVFVGGLVFIAGQRSVQSAPAKLQKAVSRESGWQTYKDARLGFMVARPAGWTVRADSRSILVQNPARTQTVLTEVFTASPGETAEAHLNTLAGDRAALFPDVQIGDAVPQESKGDEVAASLSFGGGTGQGRALCSIVNGKGLLFVLAASGGSFAADQPVLTHIVKSLRFTVPASSTASAKGAAAQAASAVRGLHFVSWTEPREHGFQIDVPRGWKAEGGSFSFGPTDLRIAYAVTSPAKDMQVVIGDPRLPSAFLAPNEMNGGRDGMSGGLHYMPAVEFNHWYLTNFGRQVIDNLVIGADHPLPEISHQWTITAQRMFGPNAEVEVNVGTTEFSGISKETHKQFTGILIGSTKRMTSRGMMAETTTWTPGTMILTCNDDAVKARNQQTVMAVFFRILQSYHENAAWVSRHAQEGDAESEQIRAGLARDSEQRIAQMSAQISRSSDAARESSMGAYWGHANAQDEQQRGFVNYLGDRTDVSGGGETTNVQSGSSHYYRNSQTGDVLGTDSAYSPGVDFTPLTER